MSKVYFISDPHFGHKNIGNLRGMDSDTFDSLIIENWNKTVNKRDIVYVLGDITMEDHNSIGSYLSQLKGVIRVVGGNHDTLKCCKSISGMGITVMGCLLYKGFICTHIPIHPHELHGRFRGNIHGHIHNQSIDLGEDYFNVVCERIGYTPMLFDDIVERFTKKRKLILERDIERLPRVIK